MCTACGHRPGRGRGIVWLLVWVFFGLGAPAIASAALKPAVQAKVMAATFEVVRAKPANDPLTYAKALPLDQLPPRQRNDRYNSIGYAAAIGKGRYVTAASLLYDGPDSLWGPPELRDAEGHVYAIDKIVKLVLPYDLAVFTLATQPDSTATLRMSSASLSDAPLYTLGEDPGTNFGLHQVKYTTTTAAKDDGDWRWIRFSADTRPDAGPLLDQAGDVVGVISGTRPADQDGYYALPIDQVSKASSRTATLDKAVGYRIPILGPGIDTRFQAQFALPESVADFNAQYASKEQAFRIGQLQAILDRPSSRFPAGADSYRMLYATPTEVAFPTFLVQQPDKNWGLWADQAATRHLPDGAVMQASKYGDDILFRLHVPGVAAASQLHLQTGLLMNDILQALPTYRTIGSARVAIASLGTPTTSTRYTDRWQRIWNVRIWPLPYKNYQVSVLALPVPDGYVGILGTTPTADMRTQLAEFKALANFFYASYTGTLLQWEKFLSDRAGLPKALSDMNLRVDMGESLNVELPDVQIAYTQALQGIEPGTLMAVTFGYGAGQPEPELDVRAVHVMNDMQSTLEYTRVVQPPKDAGDAYQTNWKQLTAFAYPKSLVASTKANDTQAMTTVAAQAGSTRELYMVAFGLSGKHDPSEMKAKLGLLMQGFHVVQH